MFNVYMVIRAVDVTLRAVFDSNKNCTLGDGHIYKKLTRSVRFSYPLAIFYLAFKPFFASKTGMTFNPLS